MRDRINLAVAGPQRRHDKRAAEKACRVADGGDVDVDLRSGPCKRRQCRGDDNGGDIPGPEIFALHVDAKPFKKPGKYFLRIRRISETVARAVQADHEAIADEIVRPHAFDCDNILQADLRAGGADGRRGEGDEASGKFHACHRRKLASVSCESREVITSDALSCASRD